MISMWPKSFIRGNLGCSRAHRGSGALFAGVVAQMGVLYYMVGRYADLGNWFESAVAKSRAIGERKSTFFALC